MPDTNVDVFTHLIARYLNIADVTTGGEKENYLVRYRGQLYGDSAQSYEELASALKPYQVTPLFRKENEQAAIFLVPGLIEARPSNAWINLVLFLLTMASMVFAGTLFAYNGPLPDDPWSQVQVLLQNLRIGVPFAIALLAILGAHEFGHYLAARYHRTQVTLPYFLPFPLSPFGTMGAFIRLKEPPRNKRILLDIGIAGPLAGLVIAIPVLLYGLSLSQVQPILVAPGQGFQIEGNSILYLILKYIVFQQWLPAPSDLNGLSPLLYWVRYFFTGQPLPIGGLDVMIHPIAWAGWAGLLVTALNLIPAGQLDGGHVIYTLIGKRARYLWPAVLAVLVILGFFWSGWWLWAVLILLLGRLYAEPLDQITTLDTNRQAVAVLGLILFLLVFTPVPLIQFFGQA